MRRAGERSWRSCASWPPRASASSTCSSTSSRRSTTRAPDEDEHEQLLAARERLRRCDALCSAAGAGAEALAPDSGEAPAPCSCSAAAAARLDALAGVDPRLDALAERMRALVDRVPGSRRRAARLRRADSPMAEDRERSARRSRWRRSKSDSRRSSASCASTAAAIADGAAVRDACPRAPRRAGRRARSRSRRPRSSCAMRAPSWSGTSLALRRARQAAAPRLADAVCASSWRRWRWARRASRWSLTARAPGPAAWRHGRAADRPQPRRAGGPAARDRLRRRALAGDARAHHGMRRRQGSAGRTCRAEATLVFDEVDAGIGGHTARAVGARLRRARRDRQVLCITHLPQIASLGARHFSIVKDTSRRAHAGDGRAARRARRRLRAGAHARRRRRCDSAARRTRSDLRRAA